MSGSTPELVRAVLKIIEARLPEPFSLDGLTEVEADLLGAVTAVGVIGNGGFYYWYRGKDARSTTRIAAAFDRLGLSEVAQAIRSSLAAFPSGRPPGTLAARQKYLTANREQLQRTFEPLDRVVWAADFDGAAARYIDARRTALMDAAPELDRLLRTH